MMTIMIAFKGAIQDIMMIIMLAFKGAIQDIMMIIMLAFKGAIQDIMMIIMLAFKGAIQDTMLIVMTAFKGAIQDTTIIIITFKGAIQDFFTISPLRRKLSRTHKLQWPGSNHVQVMYNTSIAYHVQHMSPAMRYEWTAHLLSLTDVTEFKSHLFQLISY